MLCAEKLLAAIEAQYSLLASPPDASPDHAWETSWVGGRILAGGQIVILFRWMHGSEVYGAVYDVDSYARMFRPNDIATLVNSIVFNDLAGPPGPRSARATGTITAGWADGLVSQPHRVNWVLLPEPMAGY